MSTHSFRAMGTDWWLEATGVGASALASAERLVREGEQRFSRFDDDSALSRLNRERRIDDLEMARLLRTAERIERLTCGAFNVGMGDALIEAGYDRSFDLLSTDEHAAATSCGAVEVATAASNPSSNATFTVDGGRVALGTSGRLDLGGIAKGWTVDRVASHLIEAGAISYLVDGGGDIRVGGFPPERAGWPIGIGSSESNRAVMLNGQAIATSSTLKRRWIGRGGPAHHIIEPWLGTPALTEVARAVVIASDATTADALATALIADRERGYAALSLLDAEAFIETSSGTEFHTPGFAEYLQ